ncbi:MAG: PorT family protein [Bacteroidetes bacterium]|nr:PorT family protein [Bacteroidota bacterium]
MKKIFLCAAVAIMSFATAQSQEVRLGIKGGYNMTTLTGDIEDASSRSSFHLGGLVEVPISERFSIQPEVLYSSQGAEYRGTLTGADDSKITAKLDYIQVPIMAKFYAAEGFAVEAGPQVGFLMSAKEDFSSKTTAIGQTGSASGSFDVKEKYKGIDFGLGIGAAYRLDMGLFFGARYNLGLSNINDISNATVKNNVFQISVGYSF